MVVNDGGVGLLRSPYDFAAFTPPEWPTRHKSSSAHTPGWLRTAIRPTELAATNWRRKEMKASNVYRLRIQSTILLVAAVISAVDSEYEIRT